MLFQRNFFTRLLIVVFTLKSFLLWWNLARAITFGYINVVFSISSSECFKILNLMLYISALQNYYLFYSRILLGPTAKFMFLEMNFTCNNSWSAGNNSLPYVNDSSSSSNSRCLDSLQSIVLNPYAAFFPVAFGSSIFIAIVSFITVVANGCLLFAFFEDPLKIFRSPTTYFLIGLTIADLLSALVQEPIYAACFMLLYFQSPSANKCPPFMAFGKQFVSTTMTVSFIIVFAFTLTQYIVVSSPLKYARLVTKKKVLIGIATIYVYSTVFWCLPLMGLSAQYVEMLDLIVHNYVLVVSTVILYILLHRLMKKKMAAGNSLQGQETSREDSKHTQVQRSFVRVNFMLLAVLIMCAMPPAVMWTIVTSRGKALVPSVSLLIGQLMSDNLLYLKSLLNPIVYAWRLTKYRQAFYKSFRRKKSGKYSQERKRDGHATRRNYDLAEVSSFPSNAVSDPSSGPVITLLSFKQLEK